MIRVFDSTPASPIPDRKKWNRIIGAFAILAAIIAGIVVPGQDVFADDTTPTPVQANADWAPVERDFDGVTMVLVPAGCFMMGSTVEQINYAVSLDGQYYWYIDEQPVNEQCFDEPFWIDKTEVTRTQYQQCVNDGTCEETLVSDYSTEADHPINRVNWFQAQAYCEWRGGKRLPTEAEWEYAARGPDALIYPWGDDFVGDNAVYYDILDGGEDEAALVGSCPNGASWVGALDMSGNLWEWTNSLYEPYPYDANDGRERDTGSNTDVTRVSRGGSFGNTAPDLRTTTRSDLIPFVGFDFDGFRCARDYNP